MRERYARRTRTYDPWTPSVYLARQEFERSVIRLLGSMSFFPPGDRRLLEVGCGTGGNLQFFLQLGFQPDRLAGIELIEARAHMARSRLPASVQIVEGDAASIELPAGSFDVVFQSLVFSSILDGSFQQVLADRMWHLVRPGGGVLWYDFVYDNPRNPDVRGVPISKVKRLFPTPPQRVRSVTLAPPVARLVTAVHPGLYPLFNVVAPLRTHRLCWIPKS